MKSYGQGQAGGILFPNLRKALNVRLHSFAGEHPVHIRIQVQQGCSKGLLAFFYQRIHGDSQNRNRRLYLRTFGEQAGRVRNQNLSKRPACSPKLACIILSFVVKTRKFSSIKPAVSFRSLADQKRALQKSGI